MIKITIKLIEFFPSSGLIPWLYIILFYFILFYFILFYFILFYFTLFYFILFYFILFYFIFNLLSSRLPFKLFNYSFVVFLHNELRHMHKQEIELWTCVCTSLHFRQLFIDHPM